jgi:DNA-binding NarL/FixJ family response regulator
MKNWLIIEDDTIYFHLINQFILSAYLNKTEIQALLHTKSIKETLRLHENGFDAQIIILDLNITDSQGINSYSLIRDIYPESHVIVVSSVESNEIKNELIALGVHDYIFKRHLSIYQLSNSIQNLLDSVSN